MVFGYIYMPTFVVNARAITIVGALCWGIQYLPLVFKWSSQLSLFQRLHHAACEPYENLDTLNEHAKSRAEG